jgi:hypothetical protein
MLSRVSLIDLVWVGIEISSVVLLVRNVMRELVPPHSGLSIAVGGTVAGILGGVAAYLFPRRSSDRLGDAGLVAMMVVSLLLALLWERLADVGNPAMWAVYSGMYLGAQMMSNRARSAGMSDGG